MCNEKVAVVTGSNKGIGYAIVKGLCEKFDGHVYLTARDVKRGQEAIKQLQEIGYNPKFHQLDINVQQSIDTFKKYLENKYGGLDVLVNNAAIAYQLDAQEPLIVQAKETIRVNYYGTLRLCQALFPLLRQNGRVVNISSSFGHLSKIKSSELRSQFSDKNITIDQLNQLMDEFVRDASDEEKTRGKWATLWSPYVVSKVGISCLSMIQQKIFDAENPNRNIFVNSVHPGYINTDMTRELTKRLKGALSIEEGARAPLYLALEANLKGKYVWQDSSVVDWEEPLDDDIYTDKSN